MLGAEFGFSNGFLSIVVALRVAIAPRRACRRGDRKRITKWMNPSLTHMWNGPTSKVFLELLIHWERCSHMSGL